MVSQHDCHSLKTGWKTREFEGVQGKNFVVVFKCGLGTEGFRLGSTSRAQTYGQCLYE